MWCMAWYYIWCLIYDPGHLIDVILYMIWDNTWDMIREMVSNNDVGSDMTCFLIWYGMLYDIIRDIRYDFLVFFPPQCGVFPLTVALDCGEASTLQKGTRDFTKAAGSRRLGALGCGCWKMFFKYENIWYILRYDM